MRSIDQKFYKSSAWIKCRASYLAQHPLCEECLAHGEYTPAEHVHHIVWLNQSNAENPEYTLGFNNLKAVCHTCHNKIHSGHAPVPKRYSVDIQGHITVKCDGRDES